MRAINFREAAKAAGQHMLEAAVSTMEFCRFTFSATDPVARYLDEEEAVPDQRQHKLLRRDCALREDKLSP